MLSYLEKSIDAIFIKREGEKKKVDWICLEHEIVIGKRLQGISESVLNSTSLKSLKCLEMQGIRVYNLDAFCSCLESAH